MLNYRIIARAFAGLIGLEGLLFLVCWLVGLGYGETHHSTWYIPIGICAALSVILGLLGGKGPTRFERRDGFFIVAMVWLIYCALGMLPFLFGRHLHRVSEAFSRRCRDLPLRGRRLSPTLTLCRTRFCSGAV